MLQIGFPLGFAGVMVVGEAVRFCGRTSVVAENIASRTEGDGLGIEGRGVVKRGGWK